MPTISVPLTAELDRYVTQAVKRGDASTKADLMRRALKRYAEDEAINSLLRAEQELKEGKILRGDLRKLAKALPNA